MILCTGYDLKKNTYIGCVCYGAFNGHLKKKCRSVSCFSQKTVCYHMEGDMFSKDEDTGHNPGLPRPHSPATTE